MTTDLSSDQAAALVAMRKLPGMPAQHAVALAGVVRRHEVAREQQLFQEGDEGGDFLLVGSGELEARRRTPFGEQRVALLEAGDLVGELSLLDGKPRSSGVVAISDALLWRFPAEELARLLADVPGLELALLGTFCRSLARKLRQANQVMTQIMAPGSSSSPGGAAAPGERGDVDQETRRRLLREQGMASAELDRLATLVEAHRFAAGDPIFSEGEPGDSLYIVADGQVRISRRIGGMGEEAIAILGRGEVFGEMAWIDSSPRSADAIAHTGGCTVLAVGRAHLDGSIEAEPAAHAQLLKTLCQVLCRRLRAMNDQLVAYRTIAWF